MSYGFYIRFLDSAGDELRRERHTFGSLFVCHEQAWKLLQQVTGPDGIVNPYSVARVEVSFFSTQEVTQ